MNFDELDESENIIRALMSSDWDPINNRWSSKIFTGDNISVSRLSILSFEKITEILKKELEAKNGKILLFGEINVGSIKELGKNFQSNNHPDPRTIDVIAVPTNTNPSHAEIKGKISRKLSLQIIGKLKMHKVQE